MTIQEHIEYLTKRGYIISANDEGVDVYNSGNQKIINNLEVDIHISALRAEKAVDIKNYIILASYPINFLTEQ